jgi:hypothetical protein
VLQAVDAEVVIRASGIYLLANLHSLLIFFRRKRLPVIGRRRFYAWSESFPANGVVAKVISEALVT